jgi:hypothetical protein
MTAQVQILDDGVAIRTYDIVAASVEESICENLLDRAGNPSTGIRWQMTMTAEALHPTPDQLPDECGGEILARSIEITT